MRKGSGTQTEKASKGGKSFQFQTGHARDDSTSGTGKRAGLMGGGSDLNHSLSGASEAQGYPNKKNRV